MTISTYFNTTTAATDANATSTTATTTATTVIILVYVFSFIVHTVGSSSFIFLRVSFLNKSFNLIYPHLYVCIYFAGWNTNTVNQMKWTQDNILEKHINVHVSLLII